MLIELVKEALFRIPSLLDGPNRSLWENMLADTSHVKQPVVARRLDPIWTAEKALWESNIKFGSFLDLLDVLIRQFETQALDVALCTPQSQLSFRPRIVLDEKEEKDITLRQVSRVQVCNIERCF